MLDVLGAPPNSSKSKSFPMYQKSMQRERERNLSLTFYSRLSITGFVVNCFWFGFTAAGLEGVRGTGTSSFLSSSASSASPLNSSSVKQKPNRVIQFKVTIVQALETELTVIIFICRSHLSLL